MPRHVSLGPRRRPCAHDRVKLCKYKTITSHNRRLASQLSTPHDAQGDDHAVAGVVVVLSQRHAAELWAKAAKLEPANVVLSQRHAAELWAKAAELERDFAGYKRRLAVAAVAGAAA
ncbi:hypothetical protein ACP70R_041665 [Stipagrostis hirtigluma subsp. patula]